jgi:hypothetical protein
VGPRRLPRPAGGPRPARHRALLILTSHLEASLLEEGAPEGDLAAARREHEALLARANHRDDDYAITIRRLEQACSEVDRAEPALTA